MRTYQKGRPTAGWRRGARVTDQSEVKPGDTLIQVSRQFQAENLVRVVEGRVIGFGFYYEYIDNKTGQRSDGQNMFCHGFELEQPSPTRIEFYRATRQLRRIRNLPSWLFYPKMIHKAATRT